jgi:XTP/dITP diphosphohydrolase
MKIAIATQNPNKQAELSRILQPFGVSSVDIFTQEVEETGGTFEENARLKALAGCRAKGFPCIGDDSGLCVDALNGEPGIFSARYAGEHGNDKANIEKLLKNMENIQENDRTAQFICVICCIFPDGREIAVRGVCEGKIAYAPRGKGGFGYDPVFLPNEFSGEVTMAQLNAAQKDEISHRGKALLLLRSELEKCI